MRAWRSWLLQLLNFNENINISKTRKIYVKHVASASAFCCYSFVSGTVYSNIAWPNDKLTQHTHTHTPTGKTGAKMHRRILAQHKFLMQRNIVSDTFFARLHFIYSHV